MGDARYNARMFLSILLWAWLGLALLYWAWAAYASIQTVRNVPVLSQVAAPDPPDWPRLSLIVTARDEEDSIESAAKSLLAQDYPNLQVVLVDDRSADRTGEIMDRLAVSDIRATAVHVTQLPSGWLGKLNAMQAGLERADGELILFTDADVHFSSGVLRQAVAWFEQDRLDHLAALPGLWPTGRLLTAMIAGFLRQLNMRMRFWAVADPRSSAFMGVGAFNLVRRSAFERTEGLAWLRLEIADDAGLGMMMKRSGARCRICNARSGLGLHWYRTIRQMMRGMEKGYAPIADCRLWRAGIALVLMLALELAPLLAAVGGVAWAAAGGGALAAALAGGGAAMIAFALAGAVAVGRWAGIPALSILYWPAATLVLGAGLVRSAVLGSLRGGVRWRDTFYPAQDLRRLRRVKL